MPEQPRSRVSTNGLFLSVPGVFDRAGTGLRHAVKMQFSPVLSEARENDGTARTTVDATFATDRLLVDLGAVRPAEVDFDRAKRDCELISEALEKHPEVLTRALELFTGGPPDMDQIRATASALESIGLTEDRAYDNGGGILAVLALVALVVLASGCSGCPGGPSPLEPNFPTSPGPMDAGANG